MITLLGVGHVFDIKVRVREEILRRGPAVVGLELDRHRFHALTHRDQARGGPIVYRLLSGFQERVAEQYGGHAGDEMLAAARAAREVGANLAFIDMEGGDLMGRLWRSLSFEERVKLLVAAVSGFFVRKKTVEKEMQRYESNQAGYLDEFSRQFPTVKRILVDERDAHMARNLRALENAHGRVLGVVGDGHVEGIVGHLTDLDPEVVRLATLRRPSGGTNAEISYSFTYRG